MLKYIFITVVIMFCNNITCAHSDTLITQLNDENVWIRENALSVIEHQRLIQYIPVLEEIIFEQSEPVMIKRFLEVLASLNAENIQSITYQFIEMADNFENMFPKRDPLEMKVIATEILFDIDDYSTVDYVFELAERDYPFDQRSNLITISMLGRIINELPSYEQDAKTILIQSLNNSPIHWVRMMSLGSLSRKYGPGLMSQYISTCTNDESWTIRVQAIEKLKDNNYSGLNNLLRDRLINDEEAKLRRSLAFKILKWFGEPSDYKYLKDYLPTESDENAKSAIRLDLATFRPPKPGALDWNGLTTRLISYTNEMNGYAWITNTQTRDYYLGKLNGIIESLTETSQIDEACSIIETQILPQLENDLNVTESITIEAYKFLHHYTNYIKEELEEQYGACP